MLNTLMVVIDSSKENPYNKTLIVIRIAAYAAVFLYNKERFDLNVLSLAVIRLILVWLANRLKQ